jgi:hypothetical protein
MSWMSKPKTEPKRETNSWTSIDENLARGHGSGISCCNSSRRSIAPAKAARPRRLVPVRLHIERIVLRADPRRAGRDPKTAGTCPFGWTFDRAADRLINFTRGTRRAAATNSAHGFAHLGRATIDHQPGASELRRRPLSSYPATSPICSLSVSTQPAQRMSL